MAPSDLTPVVRTTRQRRRVAWQGIATLSLFALIPIATGAMATVDAATQGEMERFLDVLELVRDNYVESVDDSALIKGAIDGMLASLDPHSAHLDAGAYSQLLTQIDGEYGGIGLSVTMENKVVKVIAPQADTPASRAGIKAGDYITHINGELIVGMTIDEAVKKMRGKPNTSLTVTIVREGRDQPIEMAITREIINIKPVKWKIKDDIAIVTITSFSANATQEVAAAIRAAEKSLGYKPKAYIIDLRSNPGGLLDEAVGVSDLFLENGEIVSQRGRRQNKNQRYFARSGDITKNLPVIVLIDAGSASASEIVAGALQDHRRALIMGQRSFGKGSVQVILPLDDTTALRLTTARYYTPSGRSVQEGGIKPDIRVPQLSDPDYQSKLNLRESTLRHHLINEANLDDEILEKDDKKDPRFLADAEELKAMGIDDFQLNYALKTLGRLDRTYEENYQAIARSTPDMPENTKIERRN